jgi:hypothetical protein
LWKRAQTDALGDGHRDTDGRRAGNATAHARFSAIGFALLSPALSRAAVEPRQILRQTPDRLLAAVERP